ncbi:MAG TPA: nitroreductase/quinone reductase family protein [Acidimicrobiales bacterium]|nr:nitroreductase/quinone reductase family protein [Acidimicrobiales bacterium]
MATPNPAMRSFLRFHQRVYEATGGLVGHHLIGVPCLLLHTTGRHSGQRRTVALVYARDGERDASAGYAVVASNHGMDAPPAWLLNLEAAAEAEIQLGRHTRKARAEVYRPGDEDYARLWQLVNDGNHHRYERYQAGTARPIPVVRLVPV